MADDNLSPGVKKTDEPETLELPRMVAGGLAVYFGPGIILMMTGIGTSHLITAPVAGGRFEFALLWCIPVAYIFKYYGFEMAFRFTHATGRSMLDAYATAWKKWPLWYVLITTLIQMAVGQAGRLIAAALVMYIFMSQYLGVQITYQGASGDVDLGIPVYAFLLGAFSVVIIQRGNYGAVELVGKISAGVLVLSSIAVYVYQPAPLSAMGHFFVFETPHGSWLIIAAFLGLLPTGMDVSLQASEWGKAKKIGTCRVRKQMEEKGLIRPFDPLTARKEDLTADLTELPPQTREYCLRWFKIGLWDFRLGHIVSFVIVCIFLLLAAVSIYPSEVEGRAVMEVIAGIFPPGMKIVFWIGAFAATFSTSFNYFDGWPRVVSVCCRNMFRPTAKLSGIVKKDLSPEHRRAWYSEYNLYRGAMFFSLIASVILIAGVPKPVWLVLVASALAFFIAPVIFFLNFYYCLTVIPKKDKSFYPSTFAIGFGSLSLIVFTGLTVLLIMAKIFKFFD